MTGNAKQKHITRKILLGLLIAFLLFIGIFFLIDYSHYRRDPSPYRTLFIPRLEVSLFQVTELSASKAEVLGKMMIHNPLPVNLRADSVQYKLYISDVKVVESTYPKSMNIKRWDTTLIELPVTAYNEKMINVLKDAEKAGKDSVIYRVEATFASNIPWRQHFNIHMEKLLPLIYIPEVKMDTIGYDSLNAEGITLMLHAAIINKNKFPLQFKDMKFKFALADNPWVEGSKQGVIDIKETSTTSLILPLRISFKQIGKSIGPLITHGKNTGFKFVTTLKLVSDNNAIRDSKIILRDEGTLKEILQLAKEEKQEAKEKKKEAKARGEKPEKKEKHHLKIKKEKNIKK